MSEPSITEATPGNGPAELTVPMAVLERWLTKAFEAGKGASTYDAYSIMWKLADDNTLSPVFHRL